MTTVTNTDQALPRWDLTTIYPSPTSRDFAAAHEALQADVARLQSLYDRHDVRGGDRPVDDAAVGAVEEILTATNDVLDQSRTLNAFLYASVTADASDDVAQALTTRLQADLARLSTLQSRLAEWIAALGPDALADRSTVASDHRWPLQQAARSAEHQMPEPEEDLAAELRLTGSGAWARMYRDVTSGISAVVPRPDGSSEELPITAVRALASDPDAGVREAAYRAELEAWEAGAVPIAAALNAIKGESVVLNRRRGWSDALEPALFANAVDRATLDAMLAAVVASLPDFRRYLRAKARLLGGRERLPWWDLFAPVSAAASGYDWSAATETVERQFGTYSPQLAALVRRAMSERWVDAEPRKGKTGGAYCVSVREDESRVLMNYDGSFNGIQTLAHELGHAYHNTQLAGRTPLQRRTPMALAETASIFCETIVVNAGLASAEGEERLALLDTDLQGAAQVVVDIYSRFLFESEVFRRREQTTLSVRELCDLMLDAQERSYGDGLDPEARHPYMWAVKPHYYSTAFYNWPYTFGLLFGIGLFARYREDPERFRGGYDELLSSTGLGDAAALASRFGIDVRDEGFWTSSLDVLRERITMFEELAG
jgi:pepF/M3 family oligoendopeptidase